MTQHDPLERLRRANPARTVPPADPAREQLLERITASPASAQPRRCRRWTTALAAAVLVLTGTGAAIAATGIRLPFISGPTILPGNGGTVVASSIGLLPLRVEDPSGGARWGLRVYRTSRNRKCVDVGRVVEGRLGGFDDKGAFVERPAGRAPCTYLPFRREIKSSPKTYGLTAEELLTDTVASPYTSESPCALQRDVAELRRVSRQLRRTLAKTPPGSPNRNSRRRAAKRLQASYAEAAARPTCQPGQLRRIAYGIPTDLNSAYLVVLPGTATTQTLRTRKPCQKDQGRLIAAVQSRCPR